MTVSAQRLAAAQSLAVWLARTHPDLFNRFATLTKMRGLQQLGRLGDDTFLMPSDSGTPILADPTMVDVSTPDLSTNIATGVDPIDAAPQTASGFLSSVGSGIGSAVSGVTGFLTSSQGLSSLTNLATSYFKAQSSGSAAAMQSQVLQAQAARAAAGMPAARITYTTNPLTGQLQPVIQSGYGATSQYSPLTPTALNQLNPMSQYMPYLLIGGALVLVLALAKR